MKETQNQIRYHRFIDSLVEKNNAKYIEKSDEQMKKQLIESDNESYLIIEIHDMQVVFILLSMGLLLSFTVFFTENIVFRAKEGIKFRQKLTQFVTYSKQDSVHYK